MGSVPTRIAVGVDASREAADALDHALGLAAALGVPVTVVHAEGLLEGAGYANRVDLGALVAEARRRVATPPTVATVTRAGPPADTLLRVAAEQGADLVVVGRRGVGGSRARLGSTSAAVLEAATVAVLVLAPHAH